MFKAILAIVFSVILLNLAWTVIPTTIAFFILMMFGIHIAFWHLYAIVFVIIFILRLF